MKARIFRFAALAAFTSFAITCTNALADEQEPAKAASPAPPAASSPAKTDAAPPLSPGSLGVTGGQRLQPELVLPPNSTNLIRKAPVPGDQYGGLLPQMAKSPRPLEVLSPFAPASMGDGRENLSLNPITGQAEGVTLFSIHFNSNPKPKLPKAAKAERDAPKKAKAKSKSKSKSNGADSTPVPSGS